MRAASPCPEPDALQRLALNQAEPDEALQTQRHLVHCVMCAQMLRSLQDAALTLSGQPPPVENVPAKAVPAGARKEATAPVAVAAPPEGAAEFPFLHAAQDGGELGRLGPYRILKKLGEGGMGVVFSAEDMHLQRQIALKVMLPDSAKDPEGRARFVQEARATAAIEHDHIVTIYQVGEDNGVPYLAMQLLQGETLSAALRREGKLPLRESLRIGREIADGLGAAHARNLIHRDIKPANIWLEAGKGRVKILDFGLARQATDGGRRLTQTSMIIGTAGYMSPEQARGQRTDGRSDLFSLGCVLYEMSTGREPFPGRDPMARLAALYTQDPRPPQQVNSALPRHFSDFVLWLLAKDPLQRPRTAQAVADALRAIEQQRGSNSSIRNRLSPPGGSDPATELHRERADSEENRSGILWVGFFILVAILAAVGFQLVWVLLQRAR